MVSKELCRNLKQRICSIFQESQIEKKDNQHQRKLKQQKKTTVLVLEDLRDFQEATKERLQGLPYKHLMAKKDLIIYASMEIK